MKRLILISLLVLTTTFPRVWGAYTKTFDTYEAFTNWTLVNLSVTSNKGPVVLGWFEDFNYPDGTLTTNTWVLDSGLTATVNDGILQIVGNGKNMISTTYFADDVRYVAFRHYGRYPGVYFKATTNLAKSVRYDAYYSSTYVKQGYQLHNNNTLADSGWKHPGSGFPIPSTVEVEGYNTLTMFMDNAKFKVYHNNVLTKDDTANNYDTRLGEESGVGFCGTAAPDKNPSDKNFYDWIHVIDTNTGYAVCSNVNDAASNGYGKVIYNVMITNIDTVDETALTYTYYTRTADTASWQQVTPNTITYFDNEGTNLEAKVVLASSDFGTYQPEVAGLEFVYNVLEIDKTTVASDLPAKTNFMLDVTFKMNIDSNFTPSVVVFASGTSTPIEMSTNVISYTIVSSNMMRLAIDIAAYTNELGMDLPYGKYDIAFKNIAAMEGAVTLDDYYYVREALLYNNSPLTTESAEDNFVPPFIRRSAALVQTSLYVRMKSEGTLHAAIYDAEGTLVRTLYDGNSAAGVIVLAWDGKNYLGRTVRAGRYYAIIQKGATKLVKPVYVFE